MIAAVSLLVFPFAFLASPAAIQGCSSGIQAFILSPIKHIQGVSAQAACGNAAPLTYGYKPIFLDTDTTISSDNKNKNYGTENYLILGNTDTDATNGKNEWNVLIHFPNNAFPANIERAWLTVPFTIESSRLSTVPRAYAATSTELTFSLEKLTAGYNEQTVTYATAPATSPDTFNASTTLDNVTLEPGMRGVAEIEISHYALEQMGSNTGLKLSLVARDSRGRTVPIKVSIASTNNEVEWRNQITAHYVKGDGQAYPTQEPTPDPTPTPTSEPTPTPTVTPTSSPSPTATPTTQPTVTPTTQPTTSPTLPPTSSPTTQPSVSPTSAGTTTPFPSP